LIVRDLRLFRNIFNHIYIRMAVSAEIASSCR
jgi:hypothetical protein